MNSSNGSSAPHRVTGPLFAWGVALPLALIFGFLAGMVVTRTRQAETVPLTIVPDTQTVLPAVVIEGIRDGALHGHTEGDVRVVAGEHPADVEADGSFVIHDKAVLTNTVTVTVPPGMHFTASAKGTRYYPVGSPEGLRIAPANKVYFATEGEAEAAGFTHW